MKARQVDEVLDAITERQGLTIREKRLASMKSDPAEERSSNKRRRKENPRQRRVVTLARRGLSYSDIARLTGLNSSTCSRIAVRAGVRRPPGSLSSKEAERRKRLFMAELHRQKGRA